MLALSFALAMVGLQPTRPALAFPPLPSGFYGTVKVNGANVADGTVVLARINGNQYAITTTVTYLGNSVYSLDVPGDDATTPGTIEGGVEGDTVVFFIGGVQAIPTGTWHTGTNINMDLTASTSATLIPPQDTSTPMPTQTAIIIVNPATATPTTQAQATPMSTQTAIIVVNPPTSTKTIQAQATPTTGVRTQTLSPTLAGIDASQAIPTETNPENSPFNFNPTILVVGISAAVFVIIFILWLIKVRKPKEMK